ncbi:DEAD/DEAH box helicase [Sphingomonas sp. CGMCC 1.13654]|uniref:Transcription-repair-coupling factor n=1 Tax=Sphingomonas chungangi TaxID=2683589 RepID=A0A838L745_9SPHN|nr:TRCF domain-containing protein [Sphingomonas chungangi]MBA2934512.1 DEAD/DEAH box helicase [Sphingomonas chungangi]MVW57551.1 DEAD/DEAH box helicase [Sphingomonas chungangi]
MADDAPPLDILTAPMAEPELGVGETVAALADALAGGDLLFAAADEQRAAGAARALAAALPGVAVLLCPGSDALPGDNAPASPANVGFRVAALRQLRFLLSQNERNRIALITTGEALARTYAVPASFDAEPPRVDRDMPLHLPALYEELVGIGYIPDDRVDEPGEIALRGTVLDVFPADAERPLRIEVADGHIIHLRSFDPANQLTVGDEVGCEIGRVAEPDVAGGGVTLLDHLPGAGLAISPAAEDRRRRFLALAADAARRRGKRATRDAITSAAWENALDGRIMIDLRRVGDPPPRFVEALAPARAFSAAVRAAVNAGERVALLGSERDLRFLTRRAAAALKQSPKPVGSWTDVLGAEPGTVLTLAMPAERGFRRPGVLAIAAADLLGSRAERDDTAPGAGGAAVFALGEIRIGDVIVHEDHGIGIVDGLAAMPDGKSDKSGEAIQLRYAGDTHRLVSTDEADRIWRYGADANSVTLDKLDGSSWLKRRAEIDAAVAQSARAMTELAAERATRSAPKLEPPSAAYERFASSFAYTETPDQARAIASVLADLASGQPMERLIVGDVGYGKTEVALRAAGAAALAGKQVAVAAPTTVLARQHIETFTERFEGTGLEVAGLSRLSSAAEKKRVRAGLADGSIRVVIGTAAVAGKGMSYADLGLVIIDEEQRFGAADKARLRDLSAGHVLILSATPIPRTLQNALIGLQQLSVIATPPARRRPIRTQVDSFVPETVRTALLREKGRGGQSFVVVPRIEDMGPLGDQLRKLAPELDLLVAHGKMPAADIDEIMVRFGRGDGDVLLATNIIEAGLDVPRANTMVIWRADRFGLSQLHQLRGRVGRGSRRGQVLLLTDPEHEIAPRTLKRLRTLEAFDRLGAGFQIAGRDLDLRGAGDLLGEAQAGHMKLIGVDLYQHLFESAVRAARGEDVERWVPEMHLGVDGCLPQEWIPDEDLRLTLYARLSRLSDAHSMDAFADELEDRFGALPPPAKVLLAIARIRIAARILGIAKIDAGPSAIAITPRRDFAGDPSMAKLIEKNGRFLLREKIEDPCARLERVLELIECFYEE